MRAMSSEPLLDELTEIVPSLVGMTNLLGVPDLGIALNVLEMGLEAIKTELVNRSVTPQEAKGAIDAATQAAILAKFGPK
jgi:hypothetical protein